MSKLELTININYVKNWDVYSGIRELIQNTADAHDIGYPMKITYNSNRKEPVLTLTNFGITLKKDSLLLGTTTKSDDIRQRGCFGEGMKLGWLALLRAGLKVWIKSGTEKWVPTLSFSDTYQSELLTVQTSKINYENCVKVEVRGLDPNIWEQFRQRILFSPGTELNKNEYITVNENKILTKEDLRGQLFVKGLWVTHLPGNYWFGYDLNDIKLDRDRKLADPWDLQYAIRSVLNEADISIDDLWTLLSTDKWEETRIIANTHSFWGIEELAKKITEKFHLEFGSDIIPVENTSQSMEAAQCGLRTKVVSKAIKILVESTEGKYEDKRDLRVTEHNQMYSIDELEDKERTNLYWAYNLMEKVTESPFSLNVVDFYGEHVVGMYKNQNIFLARKVLKNRPQLIATLVHETAHQKGDDATVEHREEIERLFGELIDKLTKGEINE